MSVKKIIFAQLIFIILLIVAFISYKTSLSYSKIEKTKIDFYKEHHPDGITDFKDENLNFIIETKDDEKVYDAVTLLFDLNRSSSFQNTSGILNLSVFSEMVKNPESSEIAAAYFKTLGVIVNKIDRTDLNIDISLYKLESDIFLQPSANDNEYIWKLFYFMSHSRAVNNNIDDELDIYFVNAPFNVTFFEALSRSGNAKSNELLLDIAGFTFLGIEEYNSLAAEKIFRDPHAKMFISDINNAKKFLDMYLVYNESSYNIFTMLKHSPKFRSDKFESLLYNHLKDWEELKGDEL